MSLHVQFESSTSDMLPGVCFGATEVTLLLAC
jgi:hypothetical protein